MKPIAVLAGLALLTMGCGGSGNGSGSPTAPTLNIAGAWRGTSSAGGTVYPITFTVSGSQVTQLAIQVGVFHFSSGNQGRNCSANMSLAGPVAVSGNEFTASVSSEMGATVVRGRFTADAAASGTYDAWDITRGCSGSAIVGLPRQSGGNWSASR